MVMTSLIKLSVESEMYTVSRLGGSGPVIWSYFAEFQPKHKRGSMLSFMAAFWTLGNLFVACKNSYLTIIYDN